MPSPFKKISFLVILSYDVSYNDVYQQYVVHVFWISFEQVKG